MVSIIGVYFLDDFIMSMDCLKQWRNSSEVQDMICMNGGGICVMIVGTVVKIGLADSSKTYLPRCYGLPECVTHGWRYQKWPGKNHRHLSRCGIIIFLERLLMIVSTKLRYHTGILLMFWLTEGPTLHR